MVPRPCSLVLVIALSAFAVQASRGGSTEDGSIPEAQHGRDTAESNETQAFRSDQTTEAAERGARLETPIAPVGNHWALIIGINYGGRDDLTSPADRSVLPRLNNAVNDAEGIRRVLTTYYNYDEKRVTLLLEEEATHEAINTALTELCDPTRIEADDTVFVFFSGHGVRLVAPTETRTTVGAILPFDVPVAGGKPIGKFIELHDDLIKALKRCPAKHKLVILDSCYSGDVFHRNFQPRSEADNRTDTRLQEEASFQAMASCRATQVASDGADGHSPFTAALIEGLKRIPAQQETDRVQSNRLLRYLRPRFVKRNQQTPDCRSLVDNEGEFCFYPGDASLFKGFRVAASEQHLLRAMVASRQGNWWFQEMPWFIPSVREQIILAVEKNREQTRSQSLAQFIDLSRLRQAAQHASKQLEERHPIDRLRRSHFRTLLETHRTNRFVEALNRIADELEEHLPDRQPADPTRGANAAPDGKPELEPADIHLLALVQHALGRHDQARKTYDQALKEYEKAAKKDEHRSMHRILEALCRADLAELLLEHLSESREAAEQFGRAEQKIASLAVAGTQQPRQDVITAAAIFRVFILCREADAWLRLSRWNDANERLEMALKLSADCLGAENYLTAHVYRRRAWAEMMQWKIEDAECSFRTSNEILAATLDGGGESADDRAVDDSQPVQRSRPDPRHTKDCRDDVDPLQIPERVRVSRDFPPRLAYLHNLHGIAMARRFKGDTESAVDGYRRLVRALLDFRDVSFDADHERQFVERVINTQERLGDCNLFGHPSARDVNDAADDYRRARAWVHRLRGRLRDQWRFKLLYKQALALAQPSPVQDTALALEMCHRADALYEEQKETAPILAEALGRLATPIVEVIDSELRRDRAGDRRVPNASSASDTSAGGREAAIEAAAVLKLREAIHEFRDDVGRSPHRDQLELCLFASKVLLEHGGDRDGYQVIEDTDLLLSFCRTALAQQHRAEQEHERDPSDARSYLRPYYDAAMRSRLNVSGNRVKELLEIHWEATQGTPYVKPVSPEPILAVHLLDGNPLLLVDLPRGESRCVSLAEHCDIEVLREAVQRSGNRLPLPIGVRHLLEQWKQGRSGQMELEVYGWLDESWLETSRILIETTTSGAEFTRPASFQFPFELPAGFATATAPDLSTRSRLVRSD